MHLFSDLLAAIKRHLMWPRLKIVPLMPKEQQSEVSFAYKASDRSCAFPGKKKRGGKRKKKRQKNPNPKQTNKQKQTKNPEKNSQATAVDISPYSFKT